MAVSRSNSLTRSAAMRGLPIGLLAALHLFFVAPARPEVSDRTVPQADHVIVVMMENHSYDQVRSLPYIASVIAANTSFAQSYGITHPSQPNYLCIWSGATQGVSNDQCPPPGSPYGAENLGHACEAAGVTWKAYCEGLPYAGYSGCTTGRYVRRHSPWTNFSNLNHLRERPYGDLASDIAQGALPNLSFVIPDLCDDMHDCTPSTGDAWLAANMPAMLDALGPSGILVLTWDEDDDLHGNRILTVFAGPLVKHGYVSPRIIEHYTVLRTICDLLSLSPFSAAINEVPITDVWADQSGVASPGAPTAGAPAADGAELSAPFPNPSDATFTARLRLAPGARAEAAIFDAGGRWVAALPWNAPSGSGWLRWNGRDAAGRPAPDGLYFMNVRTGSGSAERKLVLLRENRP